MSDIRVLVVEDEPIAAAAHAAYIGRLEGFTLAGSAPDGQSALRLMTDFAAAGTPVELVLLDMNLPDLHGLDIARRMRAAGLFADIIAITAVRELNIVRSAVATGVVQYLIKPFTYRHVRGQARQLPAFPRATGLPRRRAGRSRGLAKRRGPGLREPAGPLRTAAAQGAGSVHARLGAGLHETAGGGRVGQRGHGGPGHVPGHRPALPRIPRRRRNGLPDARYGAPGRPENEYRWTRPAS